MIRRLQAGDHAQHGGLATACRSNDAHRLTAADPQTGIVQGEVAPSPPRLVRLGNALQVNFTTRGREGLAIHHAAPVLVRILSHPYQPNDLPDILYLLEMPQMVQESVGLGWGQ